jgi:hypothetical protein
MACNGEKPGLDICLSPEGANRRYHFQEYLGGQVFRQSSIAAEAVQIGIDCLIILCEKFFQKLFHGLAPSGLVIGFLKIQEKCCARFTSYFCTLP